MLPLKPLRKDPSLPLPSFTHALVCGGITQSLLLCSPPPPPPNVSVPSHGVIASVRLSLVLERILVILDWPTLLLYDLIELN